MTPFCLSSAGARQSATTVLELKGLAATSLGSPGTGQGQEVRRYARNGVILDRNTTPQQTALSSTNIYWRKVKRYCIYYIAMRPWNCWDEVNLYHGSKCKVGHSLKSLNWIPKTLIFWTTMKIISYPPIKERFNMNIIVIIIPNYVWKLLSRIYNFM